MSRPMSNQRLWQPSCVCDRKGPCIILDTYMFSIIEVIWEKGINQSKAVMAAILDAWLQNVMYIAIQSHKICTHTNNEWNWVSIMEVIARKYLGQSEAVVVILISDRKYTFIFYTIQSCIQIPVFICSLTIGTWQHPAPKFSYSGGSRGFCGCPETPTTPQNFSKKKYFDNIWSLETPFFYFGNPPMWSRTPPVS